MWVDEIDVRDEDLLRRYWRSRKEGDSFERPYAIFNTFEAVKVALQDTDGSEQFRALAVMQGDQVVGSSQLMLPLLDNTHMAYVMPIVAPARRREGIGAALLDASLDILREEGRTTAVTEVATSLEGVSPGRSFAEKHGFEVAIMDRHQILELPLGADRLEEMSAACAPHHGDYELVQFGDSVPDELMPSYCAIQAAFNDEAPSGDLDLEAEAWDEDRVRKTEAKFRRQGRHPLATVAVAADGSVAGLTELITAEGQPETVWQSGTIVLPAHRGHRLGLAVKVANLRAVQQQCPAARYVHSWNAEENGPMVAINDALGFRAVEQVAEMQRTL